MKILTLLSSDTPNENRTVCGQCGGQCCKDMPGSAYPEDFGGPDREAMRARLTEALGSGRWTIDWWEGDPRKDQFDDEGNMLVNPMTKELLGRAEYVRPAHQGREGQLYDGSWGGTPCTFLSVVGCTLSFAERPTECRALVPNFPEPCRMTEKNVNPKRLCALAWLPYAGLLDEVVEALEEARSNAGVPNARRTQEETHGELAAACARDRAQFARRRCKGLDLV